MCRSVPQIAVFSSLTSTSFGPGAGTGTCSIQMPLPVSRLTSAFIVFWVMEVAFEPIAAAAKRPELYAGASSRPAHGFARGGRLRLSSAAPVVAGIDHAPPSVCRLPAAGPCARPRRRRHVDALAAAADRQAAQGGRLQGQAGRPGRTGPAADERGGQGRRRQRRVRVQGRPAADQPPRRVRGDPVQLDARARPDRQRLHRRRPRRRTARQPRLPGAGDHRLRQGHRPHPRRRARQAGAGRTSMPSTPRPRPSSPNAKAKPATAAASPTCTTAPTST